MVKVYGIRVSLFVTNCYLVINEESNEGFLIDPGGNEERIFDVLAEKEVKIVAIYQIGRAHV